MTTKTGRVVYNRRPHFMRYKDVLRIVRSVEPVGPLTLSTDVLDIFQTILAAEADLLQAFSDRAWLIVPRQETLKFLLKTVDFILEILKNGPKSLIGPVADVMAGFVTPAESLEDVEKKEQEAPINGNTELENA